ncbi:MAG: biotin/lipoyl-containing protein [Candidatus Fimenecus sp.]
MKYQVTLNGKIYEVDVDKTNNAIITNMSDTIASPVTTISSNSQTTNQPNKTSSVTTGTGESVKAPMPGSILKINIKKGDSVKAGDVIMILEAMKMENEIVATRDGTITSITVSKGAAVDTDDILAYID